MPASVVKSAADERHWREAKAQAAEQGRAGSWKYVMGVFQRMKHHLGGEKGKQPWRNEALDVDELLSAIIEYDADIASVVDGMTETHWPAVPTWNVVVKPKPKPAPKPQVNPTAHGSMPKSWKNES